MRCESSQGWWKQLAIFTASHKHSQTRCNKQTKLVGITATRIRLQTSGLGDADKLAVRRQGWGLMEGERILRYSHLSHQGYPPFIDYSEQLATLLSADFLRADGFSADCFFFVSLLVTRYLWSLS